MRSDRIAAGAGLVCAMVIVLAGCTAPASDPSGARTATTTGTAPVPRGHSSSLPACPGAGGDAAAPNAPTRVVPDGRKPWQLSSVLAQTTVGHTTVVHATLRRLTPHYRGEISVDQRTQIFILSGADNDSPARGGHVVEDTDQLFVSPNVVAAGTLIRTSDDHDHAMSVTMPRQNRARDYYVYYRQIYSPRCRPRGSVFTAGMIGLVRIDK